jgi:hypothetical protein
VLAEVAVFDAFRFSFALRAAGLHFLFSVFFALVFAILVFFIWYPYPYAELSGGKDLFLLLIAVDIVCGPLLTLVIFSPSKSRIELRLDIALVVLLQAAALVYGVLSVVKARPVFLAFEGSQYRVVTLPDVQLEDLDKAPKNLQELSLAGPKLIGVRLINSKDSEYLQSIKLALEGVHPAFRPSRWLDYQLQVKNVIEHARPLNDLRLKHPKNLLLIDGVLERTGLLEKELGYLPLTASESTDWIVIVELTAGQPKAILHLDGW